MKEGARTDFRVQTEDEGSIHAWKGVCIMNKIYKVVWNAARNSYMVGSEFIRGSHSAGSRRISGRKLKGLVAAALLAGAILSPAGLMPASAFLGWPDNGNKKEYATVQDLQKEESAKANADEKLQSQIDDHSNRLDSIEDVNEGQQNQIDNQQKELDAQKEWNEQQDGRLDNVEEEAKKHTTVSTTDSNIQLTETVNDKGGRDYHIALNPDLKVDTVQAQSGSFGNIQINGTDENGQATNTINGLGNTTWDGVNFTSGQAATENQLWTVQQDVNANTAAIGSLNSRVNTLAASIRWAPMRQLSQRSIRSISIPMTSGISRQGTAITVMKMPWL